jgi:hypothetical protein
MKKTNSVPRTPKFVASEANLDALFARTDIRDRLKNVAHGTRVFAQKRRLENSVPSDIAMQRVSV